MMNYEDKPAGLFSHYLNDDSLVALPIEFCIEDLLPRAEVKFAVGHRDDHFVVDDQRFKVCVSIVLSGLVMLVVLPEGSEGLQPLVDVLDQPTLVVVNINSGRYVHRG